MQKKKIFTIDNSPNQKLWVLNQSEACTKNQKPNSSGYFEAPEWNERARASYDLIYYYQDFGEFKKLNSVQFTSKLANLLVIY